MFISFQIDFTTEYQKFKTMRIEKKDRKDAQTTVKMSYDLRNRIEEAANNLGITIMEYIRRSCEEKIERDKIENRITIENIRMQPEYEKELRQFITKIVREVLSEEKEK